MLSKTPSLPWLDPGQDFPSTSQAWDQRSPAPGLLAAGGVLEVDTLRRAYSQGIFPWYSKGQPPLWWSPSPRMVLEVADFRVQPSLKKKIRQFCQLPGCEVRIDSAFDEVIQACASRERVGQAGTWIVPEMIAAYGKLHRAGFAHSVETWVDGELTGGLYCVAIGKAVFGESMFSRVSDASKIALAALVGFCRRHGIDQIDCQQNTQHLASLGAGQIPRDLFLQRLAAALAQAAPDWESGRLCWQQLLIPRSKPT